MTGTDGPRKRRSRSEQRQRSELVATRLLPAEHRLIVDAAQQRGITVAAFIRQAAIREATQ